MTPLEAAISEFQKTISDLSIRIANMASAMAEVQNTNNLLRNDIAKLKEKNITETMP